MESVPTPIFSPKPISLQAVSFFMTVNIVLYFVNKIMSNLTSTFLLFTLGTVLFSVGIIKADHFRGAGPCTREEEGSSGTTAPSWQLQGPPGVGWRGTFPASKGGPASTPLPPIPAPPLPEPVPGPECTLNEGNTALASRWRAGARPHHKVSSQAQERR